jgi:hypothetical protein
VIGHLQVGPTGGGGGWATAQRARALGERGRRLRGGGSSAGPRARGVGRVVAGPRGARGGGGKAAGPRGASGEARLGHAGELGWAEGGAARWATRRKKGKARAWGVFFLFSLFALISFPNAHFTDSLIHKQNRCMIWHDATTKRIILRVYLHKISS